MKDSTIQSILDLLSGTYRPKSGAYENVKVGLRKLTRAELQGLYAMVLTSARFTVEHEG